MTDEARCVWLYAVVADGAGLPADGATEIGVGVGGGRVRAVHAAGVTAIIEDVGEDEFGEAALRRNLEDLDWLERTARAHHAVIEAMAENGPVVPMRLATVYSGDDPVADMLRQRAGDLREALSRLRGRSEWGVKAYAAAPVKTRPDEHDPATGPGAAYLRRRRTELTSRTNARQDAVAGAQAVHAELSLLSVSARLYPPQAPDLAGQAAPMVLNAAYLVAEERANEFAAAVNDLTGRHRSVRLGLTGPWPPYSFVGGSETSAERR
jgi:Gas vesicle synthesis protein GvpL/GvpF